MNSQSTPGGGRGVEEAPTGFTGTRLWRLVGFGCVLPILFLGLTVFGFLRWNDEGLYLEHSLPLLRDHGGPPSRWLERLPKIAGSGKPENVTSQSSIGGHLAWVHREARPEWKISGNDRDNFTVEVRFRWFMGGRRRIIVEDGRSEGW